MNPHKVISWIFSRNSAGHKGVTQYISSDKREKCTTKNTLPSKALIQTWRRNQKLYGQAKPKRIQQHQTSLTTKVKGTSLVGKETNNLKHPCTYMDDSIKTSWEQQTQKRKRNSNTTLKTVIKPQEKRTKEEEKKKDLQKQTQNN